MVITTVPLKYSILSNDLHDEFTWSILENKEFTYNRDQHSHRLIS